MVHITYELPKAPKRKKTKMLGERILVRPVEELRDIVLVLEGGFRARCARLGTRSTMRGNWANLFSAMDEDDSGRLDFREFEKAAALLRVEAKLDGDALRALWAYVDHDNSGEVTVAEFQKATYILILGGWDDYLAPEHKGTTLKALVALLNAAIETRHTRKSFTDTTGGNMPQARGNWFKVFQLIDVDGSGRLGYEELDEVIRAPYPGLEIKKSAMTTADVKGLWKAIDADRSGDVTVDEFMSFMRAHAPVRAKLVAKRIPTVLRTAGSAGAELPRGKRRDQPREKREMESWATDAWSPALRSSKPFPKIRGPAATWVLPRVGAACRVPIPALALTAADLDALPDHLAWIGASATLNAVPSPRARLRPPTSDALAECNSIALGSVQALQRSRIPEWPLERDAPLRIGRKNYDATSRPVHVSLELVHSPVTRGRPKSRQPMGSVASSFAPGTRPVTAPEPSKRETLLLSLGIEVGSAFDYT